MPRERIPITPTVLRWARERAGLTIDEARTKFPDIQSWEEGNSFPTYPQLEHLSEAFRVPVAVFFFPEPPDIPPIRESFRTLPDAQFDALPSAMRFLLRKAKAFQINLAELNEGQNRAERFILRDLQFTPNMNIPAMARRVRLYLGVSIEVQMAWPDRDSAFDSWREVLEQHGIAVFKDAFRNDEYSGFCLFDANFPIIYVNNTVKARQIFTLFHELSHLLFRTSGINTLSDEPDAVLEPHGRHIEILCNRFSAEFLLPQTRFDVDVRGLLPTEETAAVLSDRYHVSREFIYRRFLDRGDITEEEYQQAAQKWAGQRGGGRGGDHYWNKISYLGVNYVNLALSRYHQNRITEEELADYLDIKVRNIPKLESYFERKIA